jgi:DUF4097 and DUF4098 domain-containing protein YvlB
MRALLKDPVRSAIVAGMICGAATASADTDRQTRTISLPPGRGLSLEITIGHVAIEGSNRNDAQIEIVRHAPSADGFARIPVEVTEEEADVRIRAVQADGATDPAFRSDVTLRIPESAVLRSVRIMEGHLTLSALRGSISADLRRGPIEANGLQGTVRLETGIGNVSVSHARLSPDGLLRLRAFNGDVRLTFDEVPTDARVLALALNGTISSDIPLTMKDTWGPHWGEATLGKGEPVVSIDVITGRIEIRTK